MDQNKRPVAPFSLADNTADAAHNPLRRMIFAAVESLLGLRSCQALYEQIDPETSSQDWPAAALKTLGANYQISAADQARIPSSGACILIANHPFGGIEGLVLLDLLNRVRPDFKVMANYLLARVPQMRERLISVDPFGGEAAARTNLAPLRKSLSWLKQGGLLVIFPAGEVSSWQPRVKGVTDPEWSSTLARLVRMSKAPVLPTYFPGQNGPLFQLAGRIHPRLRTALLPRMLLNKRGQTLTLKVGNLLPAKKLAGFSSDQSLNDYLRLRTYSLALSEESNSRSVAKKKAPAVQADLIAPRSVDQLQAEIDALPDTQKLLQSGEFDVLLTRGEEAPQLLLEIGRLRELTFRQVGEGTGRSCDLDRFDAAYSHLLLWNRQQQQIVGAYRIGQVDQLFAQQGAAGLYTSTLFDFQPQLFERLKNALELGRSFIRPEYQRSYAPLLLLWKGIGHYLVQNPHYRYLFGPVSISSDYSNNSRQLMTSTLSRNYLINDLAKLVAPRLPVSLKPLRINGLSARQSEPLLKDMDEVSALVADIETDNKGIPVLLRHYLSLGGKLLAFNLDPDFSDVIDGLLLVDMLDTERKQLQRYMGREGCQFYLASQQQKLANGA